MTESIANSANIFRLAAAGITTVVAVSLVSAPIAQDVATPRHPHAIELSTIVVDLTAVAQTTANSARSDRNAAAIPQLNFAPPTPQQVVATIGVIAVASAWYTTFPITLPLSVGIGVLLNVLVKGVSMQPITLDPVFILQSSLASFLLAPYFLASPLIALTAAPKPTSASVQSNSTPASRTVLPNLPAKSGLAGSGRTRASSSAAQKESPHRTAQRISRTTDKKQAGTAGSGRATSKTTH
ncbi:hypothetical protein Y900_017615 [Mycolicibacterium aromaticivorans JS19b1 = JCM 16368]|uniref:Uncharacterized protein n=1 Tax=Mycolicibacterium aromaticivorans JS19b1 = JCM 16368 TaxID=1440774 RepID=A0A064CM00_9MYCO|nr:hypothetical protein [Mycolicibacterium aromaticivorans]KDF00707.1 hypothetical protein Y900_017615 [Mycolicibacterium aromaticivorans JS19b1 = JCM 16368]